jgi:mannose-6-phosphate isomerase-like protein (cupin superfamily)
MRALLAASGVLALVATGAMAQTAYPTVELLATGTTILGETIHYPTTGPARVTASIVTIMPGAEAMLHRHGTPMFALIQQGDLTVDYGARGQRTFKVGDSFVEAMAVTHRGLNHGSVPVKILTVSMGAEGASNVILDGTK